MLTNCSPREHSCVAFLTCLLRARHIVRESAKPFPPREVADRAVLEALQPPAIPVAGSCQAEWAAWWGASLQRFAELRRLALAEAPPAPPDLLEEQLADDARVPSARAHYVSVE